MDYYETQWQPYPPATPPVPTSAKVLAIISFACGIASLCTGFLGFLFSIPGLILSSMSRNRSNGVYLPRARTGKVLSFCGIGVSVLMFLTMFAYVFYTMMYYYAIY